MEVYLVEARKALWDKKVHCYTNFISWWAQKWFFCFSFRVSFLLLPFFFFGHVRHGIFGQATCWIVYHGLNLDTSTNTMCMCVCTIRDTGTTHQRRIWMAFFLFKGEEQSLLLRFNFLLLSTNHQSFYGKCRMYIEFISCSASRSLTDLERQIYPEYLVFSSTWAISIYST